MHRARGVILTKLLQKFGEFLYFSTSVGMGRGGGRGCLYCTVLGSCCRGSLEPWTPPPGSLGPTAADAPGALNALENANLNTCQEVGWGGAGRGFARCFSLLLGGSPFASSTIRGIQHELGAGGRGYPEISLYPKMGPATPLPFGVLWGANRYESPLERF